VENFFFEVYFWVVNKSCVYGIKFFCVNKSMVKKAGGMDIEKPKKKRENNFGISKNTFRRLAKAAGIKRISNELLEEMPKLLESFLIKAIKELIENRIIQ
jgi:hypothetical protein